LRNAIPRESTAIVAVDTENAGAFERFLKSIAGILTEEYASIETEMRISFEMKGQAKQAISGEDLRKIVNAIYSVPNGVFRMSPDINNLVEASSSLARVILKDGQFITQSLQRSSVESTKDDVANAIRATFENMGCTVVQSGDYPGWKPNPDSAILKLMAELYRKQFNAEPNVKACHAGLECGILGAHFPGMDMISFGPNIRAAHSPDEKVQISSVQKFWTYYLEVLKQIPVKKG